MTSILERKKRMYHTFNEKKEKLLYLDVTSILERKKNCDEKTKIKILVCFLFDYSH